MGLYTDDEFITGQFNNLFFMLGRLDDDPLNTAVQRFEVALLAEEAAKYMDRWGLRVSASHTRDLHRTLDYFATNGVMPIGVPGLHDHVTILRQALHIELETTVFVNIGVA